MKPMLALVTLCISLLILKGFAALVGVDLHEVLAFVAFYGVIKLAIEGIADE